MKNYQGVNAVSGAILSAWLLTEAYDIVKYNHDIVNEPLKDGYSSEQIERALRRDIRYLDSRSRVQAILGTPVREIIYMIHDWTAGAKTPF